MNQKEIDELKIFIVKIHTKLAEINSAWVASLDTFITEKERENADLVDDVMDTLVPLVSEEGKEKKKKVVKDRSKKVATTTKPKKEKKEKPVTPKKKVQKKKD